VSQASRPRPERLTLIFASFSFSPMRSVADLLADLGPDGVPSVDVARAVLSRFGMSENAPPDEGTVSDILGGLLSVTPDELEGGIATDYACVVRAICSIAPRYLNWSRAVRLLDVPEGLTLAPGSNWNGFAAALLAAPRDAQQSPAVAGLWGAWAHRFRQLQILGGLVALPADAFSFLALPGRRIVSVDDVANASQTVKSLAAQVQNSSWNSLDLIESLTQIADTDEHDVRIAVTEILEKAVKSSAELVLMALVQIPVGLLALPLAMRCSPLSPSRSNPGRRCMPSSPPSCCRCSSPGTRRTSSCSCASGRRTGATC
jgi:CCR4-NOT transcription complex subunit 1